MDFLSLNLDWQAIFYPSTPLLETVIRGTLVYLALFFILRFLTKREAGTLGITDLLVIVLLADAAQNAMSDDYRSITDGLLLVATIVCWSTLLNFLGYKSKKMEKVIKPPKILLIDNGMFIKKNMKSELITKKELMSEIRRQGIESVKGIKKAYIESNGVISIITKEKNKNSNSSGKEKAL
jgi:uncharacterized membrane protein YcaP (DUF421 family)